MDWPQKLKAPRTKPEASHQNVFSDENGETNNENQEAKQQTGIKSNRLPILARQILDEHTAVKKSGQKLVLHAAEAGCRLLEAKELILHGQFRAWLTVNVPDVSIRTCQKYIRAAKAFAKNGHASFLGLGHLIGPSKPRTPKPVRDVPVAVHVVTQTVPAPWTIPLPKVPGPKPASPIAEPAIPTYLNRHNAPGSEAYTAHKNARKQITDAILRAIEQSVGVDPYIIDGFNDARAILVERARRQNQ